MIVWKTRHWRQELYSKLLTSLHVSHVKYSKEYLICFLNLPFHVYTRPFRQHSLKRPLHGATWGRVMWSLAHELCTLWSHCVYMAGVPACITDKSLTSRWPEIRVDCRQRPLLCIDIYIILLNLNKREKYEAKWEKACPCSQILSRHFEIMNVYSTNVKHFSVYSAMRFCVHRVVQCRKCQADVPSTAK